MSGPVWFVAGAGAGIYAAFRARRAAEALTIDGMRDRVNATALGVRMFATEVAQGSADAEPAVRARLGLEQFRQPAPSLNPTHPPNRALSAVPRSPDENEQDHP